MCAITMSGVAKDHDDLGRATLEPNDGWAW